MDSPEIGGGARERRAPSGPRGDRERRIHFRGEVQVPVAVGFTEFAPYGERAVLVTETDDLSAGGLSFESTEHLLLGTRLRLAFRPDEQEPLLVTGRVVTRRRLSGRYRYGVSFDEIERGDRVRLRQIAYAAARRARALSGRRRAVVPPPAAAARVDPPPPPA